MQDYSKVENVRSLFAKERAPGTTSTKYSFISTTEILDIFGEHGWKIRSASEMGVKSGSPSEGYQRHMVRLHHPSENYFGNGDARRSPEILLINGHDGWTELDILAGVLEFACMNGLIIVSDIIGREKIKHVGVTVERVAQIIDKVVTGAPKILNRIEQFQNVNMNKTAAEEYGAKALDIVYPDPEKWNMWDKGKSVRNLIEPRRPEDSEPNLWSIFNITQEKIIKGKPFMHKKFAKLDNLQKSREIVSIERSVGINKRLWDLTEKTANVRLIDELA